MKNSRKFTALILALCISTVLFGCGQQKLRPEIAKPGAALFTDVKIPDSLKTEPPESAKYVYELGVDIEKSKEQIERCLGTELGKPEDNGFDEYICYEVNDWTVNIMAETGYWTMNFIGETEGKAEDISDEKAAQIAADYLRKHGLLSDDITSCDAIGLGEGLKQDGSYGVLFKTAYFYPQVEGLNVLGIFRIGVTVNTDGEITSVYYLTSPVVRKIPVETSSRAALERAVATRDYSASFSQELTDTKITDGRYSLYADGVAVNGKTYLYPVFVLLGEGTAADGKTETFDVIIDAQT